MASLPSQHPTLSIHLTDRSLLPIISSASASAGPAAGPGNERLSALTALASTALTAHTTASRLGLGSPLRIMVETGTRIVLNSFLDPEISPSPISNGAQDMTGGMASLSLHHEDDEAVIDHSDGHDSGSSSQTAPMLVSVVVAPAADHVREARRAAAKLERVGKTFQAVWAEEQAQELKARAEIGD